MAKRKRDIAVEDLKVGDIIEFYDEGFRFAYVESITKRKARKTKKIAYTVHTDRYGKVLFDNVRDIYVLIDGKTVPKSPLRSDLFV